MTIKLNDPQIEAIFVNEFKSDIDAFTKFVKESLAKRKNKMVHLDPFENSYNIDVDVNDISEEDNPFKDVNDSVKFAKELRESAWR